MSITNVELRSSFRKLAASSAIWSWSLQILVAAWSFVMVMWSARTGIWHDYGWYLEQWELVLTGDNPWSGIEDNGNAYGPVHNLLAFLVPLHPLAPKIFMSLCFVSVFLLLVRRTLSHFPTPNATMYGLLLLLVPLNALILVSVFKWGDNDALVAALVGSAILARFRQQLFLAGIFLGIAVLLKYYPAILVPFFCLDRRKISWSPVVGALSAVAIGGIATLFWWGSGFLQALYFGSSRRPSLLSPLVYVEAQLIDTPFVLLLRYNTLIIAALIVLLLLIAWTLKLSWIESATIGLFVSLVIYRVGHQQFYVTLCVLLVGLLAANSARSHRIIFACLPFVVFLSVYQSVFSQYWESGRLFADGLFLFAASWQPLLLFALMTVVGLAWAVRPRDYSKEERSLEGLFSRQQ